MRVRDWRISCLVMVVGSTSSFAVAQEIPTGPKLERYTQLWEHNPFAPVVATTSAPLPSALEGFFLSSWLREEGRDVIYVQNLQTNDVVRITTEPNRDKLRLIQMNLSSNPRLMEAVISDGNEQRAIKFRFEGQMLAGTANGEAGQPLEVGNAGGPGSAVHPSTQSNAQVHDTTQYPQANQRRPGRHYPGPPRVNGEGVLRQPPAISGKRIISHSESIAPGPGQP
jgi:hypothetical protein